MKKSTERILNKEKDRNYGTSYCTHCGARCITKKGGIFCPNHGRLKYDEITSLRDRE